MKDLSESEMRWKEYVLYRGNKDFQSFWQNHLAEKNRKILLILGKGFDPRATLGVKSLISAKSDIDLDTFFLEFGDNDGESNSKLHRAAEENWKNIQEIVKGRGKIEVKNILFKGDDGRKVGDRNSAKIFSSVEQLSSYTDVVVDISAMPQTVYFPLISRLLFLFDGAKREEKNAPNIHVIVSEDPDLDSRILSEGIDETANFLHPFEGDFNKEATGQYPKVWFPILGEGQDTQIDRIYDLVKPDEVCPVLPSPSRSPRRGDNIVIEYQRILFDQIGVDPRNIIYCSEFNPFEVYRQVRKSAIQYHDVLKLVGGCKVAVSALCNKLMSLGVLLVAYELKEANILHLGIAQIDCQGYLLEDGYSVNAESVGLWLAGECYG